MNFQHLIQINDLNNPMIPFLTRDQVWAGLLHRVEDPIPFLQGLESVTVLERHADYLLRELDFGPAVIQDRVTMQQQHWVRFDIIPSEQHAGGSLTITIEEPEPGSIFLRFAYETTLGLAQDSEDRAYFDYIRSAYQQSDLDCVRLIRELTQSARLQ